MLHREFQRFERQVRSLARRDDRARLLMSTPGVGVLVSLTYASTIWFDAQIDLEPEKLVFIDGEALSAIGPSAAPNRDIDQDGQALWASAAWRTLSGIRATRTLENHDLRRRAQT